MNLPSRSRRQNIEKGQATIEFLMIMPLVLLILALVLYSGWYFYAKLSAQNAAYGRCLFSYRAEFQSVGVPMLVNTAGGSTLDDPSGMKKMWQDWTYDFYGSGFGSASRLGGTGYTFGLTPTEMVWSDMLDIISDPSNAHLPRATAYCSYSPLMTANDFLGGSD